MSITGEKRERTEFEGKVVGLFEGKVIIINPSVEEYSTVLGIDLPEESRATEYLGESKDGNTTLRVNIWVEDVKTKRRLPISFYLEDKIRENKDGTKTQYINNVGVCTWADDAENLPEWFVKRKYREAHVGEEELYEFLHYWLGKLDIRKDSTVLEVDWKKLMKGNLSDIEEQLDGEFETTIGCLATVVSKTKDDETKEYQGVYNKAFFPSYALKNFRLIDYSKDEEVDKIKEKDSKKLKPHERFILNVTGEYGCRDFYTLKDLKEYDPEENIVASDTPISETGSDY